MVKIGSARLDERGGIAGGQAGDQNGMEVARENWYQHILGWIVFRAKDAEAAEAIARDMEYACDNDHIGYDQNNSYSLYNAAKPYAFDCSKVKTDCETDCARLARVCILYAGINVEEFYTGNAPAALSKTGAFFRYDDAKYTETDKYLRRGDILVTKSKGHIAVVLNDGENVQKTLVLATASVNIRRSPRIGGEIIKAARIGESFEYAGCYGFDERGVQWYEVVLEHDPKDVYRGWISSTYSRKEDR